MNIKVKEFRLAGFRSVFVAVVMLAALLRSAKAVRPPRVYNALITSNQQLLPSQADPIVTPVLRPFRYFFDWPAVHYAAVAPVQAVPSEATHAEDAYAASPDSSSEVPNVTAATPGSPEGDEPRRSAAGVFMNNKPAGSSVPDVPPPPLPFAAGKKDKKKAEEYPPAPVGFAI